VVESIVEPAEMRAAAGDMVRILMTLRDNLNREDGIFDKSHGKIPFGEKNPSGKVHELRQQARDALQMAQKNLVVQAGATRKLIDSIFSAVAEYEHIDAASDEQMKRLSAQLTELEGGSHDHR
jgi:hypothetical protein